MIEKNEDKFLGYNFIINDEIYEKDKGSVRYSAIQGDFKLEVAEWYYCKNGNIDKIISYYHIGDIREGRKLNSL